MENDVVFLGDCFEYMQTLPDNSVDAVVTDPPYFIENLKIDMKDATLRSLSKNNIFYDEFDHFKDLDDFKSFMSRLLDNYQRVLREKGQVYLFCSYQHMDWLLQMIKFKGFRFYKPLIWYKPDMMGVFPNQYGCNYEVILWFRKRGDKGEVKFRIGSRQRDVFKCNSTLNSYRKECGYHPTPKPLSVITQLIKNCTDEGDVVLDTFMGSGTTAVACKNIKRHFLGSEKNKDYYDIITKRLSQKNINFFEEGITCQSR